MVHLRLLVVVAATIASTVWQRCEAQIADVDGCAPPTFEELGDLLQQFIETVSSEGTPPVVHISTFYINCMSVGRVRDQFREITYTVIYSNEGVTIDSTGYADIFCFQQMWMLTFDTFTFNMGLLNNDTVTNCGRCSVFMAQGFNETTHCLSKSFMIIFVCVPLIFATSRSL